MYMPKISIIVPVYNVAEYLRRCLDSCVYQTFKDIEVIVVNDCSPNDRDDEIIQEYERDYPEIIRYIKHTHNLGLGEARNTAIRAARGTFLLFCDSDDFLDFTACEKMYSATISQCADLVVCDYYYVRDGILGYKQVNCTIDNVPHYYRPCVIGKATVWVMLIKKSLITDNKLYSPFRFCEDNITVLWYLAANKITKIDEALYYYVYRKSSLIGSAMANSAIKMAEVYRAVLKYPYYLSLDNKSKCAIFFLILNRFLGYWLDLLLKNENSDFVEFFKHILQIKNSLCEYETIINDFENINWEAKRGLAVLKYVESNINKHSFNDDFRSFYADMDYELTVSSLFKLKTLLKDKKVVLWMAGSYGQIMRRCLRNVDLQFEITDITAKQKGWKTWDELKESTEVILLTSGEFLKSVNAMTRGTEIIVLRRYLNEAIF